MANRDHAIILGGSIAGLFAAKVLSERFKKVTIIERDILPTEPEPRSGVPQSRHVHQLLVGGLNVMRELFPSIDDDLLEIGAQPIEMGYNIIIGAREGLIEPVKTGMHTFACSRPRLEHVIRKHINKIETIHIEAGYTAIDLIADDNNTVVTGVKVKKQRQDDTQVFMGDLIVDATGRTSKASQWLKAMGYEEPKVTLVDAHVGYATCWFEKPDYAPENIAGFLNMGDDNNPRAALIMSADKDKWLAMTASKNRDYPPTDFEEFLEFVKSCASPLVYNYLKDATPISPVYGYRKTENYWRHYEHLPSRPENFIITGDAACAFNPIYGHGMSVAAFDAKLLGKLLDAHPRDNLVGFADKFQKKLGEDVAVVFSLASADDLKQPSVEATVSEQSWALKQIGLYFRQALFAIKTDDVVRTRFNQVMNLTDTPTSLLAPNIMWRVIRYTLLNRFAPNLLPKLPQHQVLNVPIDPQA